MNLSRKGGVLIPTQEVESLNALLGQRETEILALTMEQQTMKRRVDQAEIEAFQEVQKLTKELSQTRTKLQAKEDDVAKLRGKLSDAETRMDHEQS